MIGETINRLKAVFAEEWKTNKWLAEKLGKTEITEITVSRWSQNRVQPSLDQLVEIARVLKVETKDPINENHKMSKNE